MVANCKQINADNGKPPSRNTEEIGMYRQRDDPSQPVASDPYGDVNLIIDGWPGLHRRVPTLRGRFESGPGLARGVRSSSPRHAGQAEVACSRPRRKIEVQLVTSMRADRPDYCEIPANRPGRAVSMERKHHLMIGVSRFDLHSADNLEASPQR